MGRQCGLGAPGWFGSDKSDTRLLGNGGMGFDPRSFLQKETKGSKRCRSARVEFPETGFKSELGFSASLNRRRFVSFVASVKWIDGMGRKKVERPLRWAPVPSPGPKRQRRVVTQPRATPWVLEC